MSMLSAALALAAKRKWYVFPCLPWDQPHNAPQERRGKAPLIDAGYKGATRDETQIKRWWTQWPTANIGVACGASGIVVVDVDGAAGWLQIEHGGYDLPETLVSRTGKPQGAHYIYAAGAQEVRNSTAIFGEPGVDVRGAGGFIIVPPSKHYSGRIYEFEDEDAQLAPAPLWMISLNQNRGGRLAAARKLIVSPNERVTEGRRNDTLYDIGCVFRRDNMIQDVDLMFGLLSAENQRRCQPPLGVEELRKIAESSVKVLPDEIELPPAGWGDAIVSWAKQTGDPNTVKKAEALKVEISDKLPEAADGRLTLSLTRYVASGVEGGSFAAVVSFRGLEVTVSGLTGDELISAERVRARCLAEKLVIPPIKRKAWNTLLDTAMAQCMDIEVPQSDSVVGACIETIIEFVDDMADTTSWADFPAGKDRYRFAHGDNSYSVHTATLRRAVSKIVYDARRKDVTAALKALKAVAHHSPGGGCRMTRVTLTQHG